MQTTRDVQTSDPIERDTSSTSLLKSIDAEGWPPYIIGSENRVVNRKVYSELLEACKALIEAYYSALDGDIGDGVPADRAREAIDKATQ